jgi:hypothetical protein
VPKETSEHLVPRDQLFQVNQGPRVPQRHQELRDPLVTQVRVQKVIKETKVFKEVKETVVSQDLPMHLREIKVPSVLHPKETQDLRVP